VTAQAEGCVQVKAGICGSNEVVMLSYWECDRIAIATVYSAECALVLSLCTKRA